jgi:hypothetical protein
MPNNIFPSPASNVSETTPEVPAVPDICFGDVRESLGPSGASQVPEAAPSLFPQLSGSAAGAAPRPAIAGAPGEGIGMMPQQGDTDWYQTQISENPSPDFYRNVIDSFGRFDGRP